MECGEELGEDGRILCTIKLYGEDLGQFMTN